MRPSALTTSARWIGWVCMGVPMLVLLIASLGKLADMPLFIASLRT